MSEEIDRSGTVICSECGQPIFRTMYQDHYYEAHGLIGDEIPRPAYRMRRTVPNSKDAEIVQDFKTAIKYAKREPANNEGE